MPVNEQRVKLLVDALRSDEFPQGHNTLRASDDTYCCLGVACEVARRNGIGIEWHKAPTSSPDCDCDGCQDPTWHFGDSSSSLDPRVSEWYGFEATGSDEASEGDPNIGDLRDTDGAAVIQVSMIFANDSLEWSFDKIADGLVDTYLKKEEVA